MAAIESNLLQHRHVFGYNPSVRRALYYAEDNQVLYPAGQTAVLTHVEKRQQTFFQGSENGGAISCMALSPNQRYLAVGEKATASSAASVSIFDVLTTRKLTACAVPEQIDAKEYVSLAFSSENQFLLTQGGSSSSGGHDYTLVYWAWDKGRAMAGCRLNKQDVTPVDVNKEVEPGRPTQDAVHDCSFHPADSSVCLVTGKNICKLLKYQDGTFNLINALGQAQQETVTAHCWLSDERIVLGTEQGQLMVLDGQSGDLDHILDERLDKCPDLCLTRFSKGFLAASSDARVLFFYHEEGTFIQKGGVGILDAVANGAAAAENKAAGPLILTEALTAKGLAIAANEESLCFSTSTAQVYRVNLAATPLAQGLEGAALQPLPLLAPFHVGAVNGMDVCVRKSLVATVGADKTVRIWNYQERNCEQWKSFSEEPFSVAIHPNGFLLIVGFSDKLRLLNIIMDDLKPSKDIPIKSCREVRFSKGGHFFAATNNNFTQVFKTYTCELLYTLRGHNNKARAVAWTHDDSAIVSCGMDGGVYEYNMFEEAHRSTDWVQKGVSFTSVAVATDPATLGNTFYICGSDRQLREVYNCSLQQSFETGQSGLTQLELSNGMRALFAGSEGGFLRCYRFPLEAQDYTDYPCHSLAVSRVRTSLDDNFVFSCGEDGSLFVFDVSGRQQIAGAGATLPIAGCTLAKEGAKRREPKAGATDGGVQSLNLLPYSDEILVTRTFLDEKQGQLVELERQVDELSNQIEFQLRHRDLYHKEKIAEFEDRSGQEIEQERAKYELLREEKNDMEMECEENIRAIEEKHAKQIQDLEASFQSKMMIEVGRYQKLSTTRDKEHAEWESEYKQILGKHTKEIEENARKFESERGDGEAQRQRILAEKDLSNRIHRETLNQLEQDADREIEELKDQYEERLTAERDDKVRLRGQAGIHRKHHEDLKRQMLKKEEEFRFFSEEARKKQEKIDASILEREQNMKEIKDRDRTIGDKETKIYELKKQNAELEKFKFVLDYKIKELRAQIEPKNADIVQMKRIIQTMDTDLEEYHRKNKTLQNDIAGLQSKQQSLQDEILLQRKRVADAATRSKKIKHDLYVCADMIQNKTSKEFRDAFSKMAEKYLQAAAAAAAASEASKAGVPPATAGSAANPQQKALANAAPSLSPRQENKEDQLEQQNVVEEYERQREYLQKSVQSLTAKLVKDSGIHKSDNQAAMNENMKLIQTITDLRKEIAALKLESQQQKNAGK